MLKKNYWGEAEDKLCFEWVRATDQREQLRIYNKLYPKLLKMVESILRRYFQTSVNESEKILDILQHVFIRLHRYDEKKKGKRGWYSFAQTIIKNVCYDLDDNYKPNSYETLKNKNKINYIDNPDYNFDVRDEVKSIANEIEYLRKEAVKKFKNDILIVKKDYADLVIERKELSLPPTKESTDYFKRKVDYLEIVIEYINNFSAYSVISLNVFVLNNNKTNMTINFIFGMTQKYFNKCARHGADITTDKAHRKQDEFPYIQDDYPSSNYYVRHKINPVKTKRRKLLRDENVRKYLYF